MIAVMAIMLWLALQQAQEQFNARTQRVANAIVEVSDEDFEKQVLSAEGPVVVDFYAEWCVPCKLQNLILGQLADARDDIKIVRVDAEVQDAVSERYNIRAYPTLLVVKSGQIVARHVGAATTEEIEELLACEVLRPQPGESEADRLLRESRVAHFNGNSEQSITRVEQALESDADNKDALYFHIQLLAPLARDLGHKNSDAALELYDRIGASARHLQGLRPRFDEDEQELISFLFYDEACAAALSNDPERAMKCLKESYAAGFKDLDHYEKDADLNSLRQRADYKEFMNAAYRPSD